MIQDDDDDARLGKRLVLPKCARYNIQSKRIVRLSHTSRAQLRSVGRCRVPVAVFDSGDGMGWDGGCGGGVSSSRKQKVRSNAIYLHIRLSLVQEPQLVFFSLTQCENTALSWDSFLVSVAQFQSLLIFSTLSVAIHFARIGVQGSAFLPFSPLPDAS